MYKTVNALGRYAWLTTAMRRRRAFTTKTHPQLLNLVPKKNENAVTQYAEGKAIICIQCLGRSKEGCEILSSLLSTRGYARTHTPRANILKVAAQINYTQEL